MNIEAYISSGIIESYVMGLCTPEEEQELEGLRLSQPLLDAAIVAYETELETKIMLQAKNPPVAVDEKIRSVIDDLTKPKNVEKISTDNIRQISWWRKIAAAAILLLVGSAILNVILFNKANKIVVTSTNSIATLPEADYKIFTDKTITPVAMYGVGLHSICRCTMFWDKKTGKMYLMIHHLPQSNDKKNYQLWAMVNDKPVNVGIIDDSIRGRFIAMDNVPAGATSFSVTLENVGGSVTPNMQEVYLQGKI